MRKRRLLRKNVSFASRRRLLASHVKPLARDSHHQAASNTLPTRDLRPYAPQRAVLFFKRHVDCGPKSRETGDIPTACGEEIAPAEAVLPEIRTMDEWRLDTADINQPPALTTLPSGDVRHEFMTWLGPGILQPKLESFITCGDGDVLEAHDDSIRIRFGKTGGRVPWHRHSNDFSVEVTLTICRDTPCVRGMTHVVADMHPAVHDLPRELIEARCSGLARDLRYCFFGQDLQLAAGHTPKPGFRPAFGFERSA